MQVAGMYEWVPASIVVATFLFGLFAEAYEAGRLHRWRSRLDFSR